MLGTQQELGGLNASCIWGLQTSPLLLYEKLRTHVHISSHEHGYCADYTLGNMD